MFGLTILRLYGLAALFAAAVAFVPPANAQTRSAGSGLSEFPIVAATADETRGWTQRFVDAIAREDFQGAETQIVAAVPRTLQSQMIGLIGQLRGYFGGKGPPGVIDLAQDRRLGTSVMVITFLIQLEGAEAFLQFRFHRQPNGWAFRNVDLQSDYERIRWN